MHFGVSAHFVQFNLLLVVAAVHKVIELSLAVERCSPHSILGTTLLKCLACLPALATGYLVSFHLKPVLFDASENVESPVIPHRWPCLNDVVGLWV